MVETILILGGTSQALEIATRLCQSTGRRIITSLAGRTRNPAIPAGEVRTGGFGGAQGLAQYLVAENISLLIDATHPFAEVISENAKNACENTGTRRVIFVRPEWQPTSGDNWLMVRDAHEASRNLPSGAIAFLALGSQHLEAFTKRDDIRFILRMMDFPKTPPPFANHALITGKPSLLVESEMALLAEHEVTHVVCRNSGGKGSFAKLAAARALSLPVLMIARPPAPEGEKYETVDALIAAIR